MIELRNQATRPGDLPRIEGLGGGIGPTEVVVVKEGESQLEPGKWVVLTTDQGEEFELTTREDIPAGTDNHDATFVHGSVSEAIGADVENPTLRLYSSADVVKKVRTTAGWLLAVTTALAVGTAGASLWFEFGGRAGPTAAQTAQDAETVLAWATEPELQITPNDSPTKVAQIRNELDRRGRLVNACLEARRGGSGVLKELSGVSCSADKPSFFRDQDNAAPTAAVLGLIAALFAGIAALRQFRAGSNPS